MLIHTINRLMILRFSLLDLLESPVNLRAKIAANLRDLALIARIVVRLRDSEVLERLEQLRHAGQTPD